MYLHYAGFYRVLLILSCKKDSKVVDQVTDKSPYRLKYIAMKSPYDFLPIDSSIYIFRR